MSKMFTLHMDAKTKIRKNYNYYNQIMLDHK